MNFRHEVMSLCRHVVMRKVSHKQPKGIAPQVNSKKNPAYMLSEGATSALDASKAGRCFGWDVRIRFGRNRQRDRRGEYKRQERRI